MKEDNISKLEEKTLKKENKFIKLIKENINLISLIPSIFFGITIFINNLCSYNYSIDAEIFYGVPSFYFYEDKYFRYCTIIILLIFYLFLFFYPFIIKKFFATKLSRFEIILYIVCSSIVMLILFLSFICVLFEKYKIKPTDIFVIILSLILTIVFEFIDYKIIVEEHFNISDNNKNNDKEKNKKYNFLFLIISFIFSLSLYSVFPILFYTKPDDIRVYEIIKTEKGKDNENQIKLVVTYYKDCAVLMDASYNESNDLTFTKNKYQLQSLKNLYIEYKFFNSVQNDDKNIPN